MNKALPRIACLLALPLLVSLMSLQGCASSPEDERDYSDLIHYDGAILEGRLKITDVVERKRNDLLQVQVSLENRSAFRADFRYKFRWFDEEGMEVGPEGEPWKPMEIPARGREHLRGVAPNPSVERFELRVRN